MADHRIVLFLCALICVLICRAASARTCQKELRDADIVPKHVDWCGRMSLKAMYNNNTSEVNCGNGIQILDKINPPTVYVDVRGWCKYFTVMMVDLDGTVIKPFLHMMTVNVPACTLRKGFNPQSKKGDLVASKFYTLDPSGTHRYTFFVFCQQGGKMKKPENVDRSYFNVRKFSQDYNLGRPIACNFFHLSLLGNSE